MECSVRGIPHPLISAVGVISLFSSRVVQEKGESFQPAEIGLAGWIRTSDPQLRRLLLCPAELRGGRMVGARGFEPPTPCSQSRCANRLRYTPTRCAEQEQNA